ncbi:Glucan endo-1,3-beta-D-glucosidase [Handroanthus impetiginosus]|uniref:Glucan endo-1,3-beta-D-glucosidase n=1 Tax=Handroanthus impetiginosus TaxID=429701 RepID=A0A2G9GJE7_9LAMI|nr:Glucan endo-1,3-beta-D-glucosidase [Handroanthus impetiginosus]
MGNMVDQFMPAMALIRCGRLGNNLPSPQDVVALYNQNNIRRLIYDPCQPALQALRGSDIEANANTWVRNNVGNYPNVRFRYIAVGNEVSPLRDTSQYVRYVLPALQNIQNAISNAGLGNQIKVSTAIGRGVLAKSYPPADGVFRSDITSYLNPIIRFLGNNGAPLLRVWPSVGGDSATLDNKRIYITNLIQRVKSGTPKRPNRRNIYFCYV